MQVYFSVQMVSWNWIRIKLSKTRSGAGSVFAALCTALVLALMLCSFIKFGTRQWEDIKPCYKSDLNSISCKSGYRGGGSIDTLSDKLWVVGYWEPLLSCTPPLMTAMLKLAAYNEFPAKIINSLNIILKEYDKYLVLVSIFLLWKGHKLRNLVENHF